MDRTYIEDLITVFDKHDLFQLAKNYSSDQSDLITREYISGLDDINKLYEFSRIVNNLTFPIFRKKYGRDRKNDGKALLDKVDPFKDDFYPIFNKIANDRDEFLKKEWDMK